MNALEEHFALWLAEVESLVGYPVDPIAARIAFECFEPPTKPLTPEEYSWELCTRAKPVCKVEGRSRRRDRCSKRPASFARRSHWYWQLVRDHQIKNWGYVRPRKPDKE
jgi:hypothetical protein